jgi:hypothetical protein
LPSFSVACSECDGAHACTCEFARTRALSNDYMHLVVMHTVLKARGQDCALLRGCCVCVCVRVRVCVRVCVCVCVCAGSHLAALHKRLSFRDDGPRVRHELHHLVCPIQVDKRVHCASSRCEQQRVRVRRLDVVKQLRDMERRGVDTPHRAPTRDRAGRRAVSKKNIQTTTPPSRIAGGSS